MLNIKDIINISKAVGKWSKTVNHPFFCTDGVKCSLNLNESFLDTVKIMISGKVAKIDSNTYHYGRKIGFEFVETKIVSMTFSNEALIGTGVNIDLTVSFNGVLMMHQVELMTDKISQIPNETKDKLRVLCGFYGIEGRTLIPLNDWLEIFGNKKAIKYEISEIRSIVERYPKIEDVETFFLRK